MIATSTVSLLLLLLLASLCTAMAAVMPTHQQRPLQINHRQSKLPAVHWPTVQEQRRELFNQASRDGANSNNKLITVSSLSVAIFESRECEGAPYAQLAFPLDACINIEGGLGYIIPFESVETRLHVDNGTVTVHGCDDYCDERTECKYWRALLPEMNGRCFRASGDGAMRFRW